MQVGRYIQNVRTDDDIELKKTTTSKCLGTIFTNRIYRKVEQLTRIEQAGRTTR
jgi:hypothetical protein